MLRDDIFDSKDRTKFFDYIIPVVPVVDSSNSYDQFISQLKSAGTFEKFDKSFLQGLSLYIDDMRLLKNIYNEFIIYYNRLNITELDCNKMLAIIAYKNLFPRDFADLQLNQGFVCTLFSKKDKFVENEVSEIKREIEEIRSKISSYKAEHLISMRELNVVFADKYLSGYDLRRQNDNDLSEFITKHLSGSSKDEYLHRRQMLKEKLDGNSDKLSQEILRLEQNIVELNDKHLHQIITRENIDSVAIDVQLDGTAEAFSLSGKGKNPVHKNVKISVENVNRFPIKHVIVFNKYITPLLKYNEVQFVHCAYYGSDDAKKWPNKLAVLTDDEFEHNEQGIPKWFNINYEDVDGNEMYQTFELKDFDGTPYYSLESINDI